MLNLHPNDRRSTQSRSGPRLTPDERIAAYCLYHHGDVRIGILAATFKVHRITMHVLVSTGTKKQYQHIRDTIDALGLEGAYKRYVTPEIEQRVQDTADAMRQAKLDDEQIPTVEDHAARPTRKASKYAGMRAIKTDAGNTYMCDIQYLTRDDPRNTDQFRGVDYEMIKKEGWFFHRPWDERWSASDNLGEPSRTSKELYYHLLEMPPHEDTN